MKMSLTSCCHIKTTFNTVTSVFIKWPLPTALLCPCEGCMVFYFWQSVSEKCIFGKLPAAQKGFSVFCVLISIKVKRVLPFLPASVDDTRAVLFCLDIWLLVFFLGGGGAEKNGIAQKAQNPENAWHLRTTLRFRFSFLLCLFFRENDCPIILSTRMYLLHTYSISQKGCFSPPWVKTATT